MYHLSTEFLKFIYCILLALAGILLFSGVIDLLSLLIAHGWRWELGSFPAVSGTLRALTDSGIFYSASLLIGFGGIARMIMGDSEPFFLKKDKE